MKVYRDIPTFNFRQPSIVTSGTYDGVHYGHQKILQRLIDCKSNYPYSRTVVISYHPHPRTVLFPEEKDLKLLTTLDEKIAQLEHIGIDHFVVIPFTKEFASKSSETFVREVLVKSLHTKRLVIGYDHKFGKNREGSFSYLKENQDLYGFQVEEISAQEIDEIAVSSTKIRQALLKGDVETAKSYLGRPYSFEASVVEGMKFGRTLGFPTANLQVEDSYKLIPGKGVYAVRIFIENKPYFGMMNIGVRPTLGMELEPTIEVHIFELNQDLYGKKISVECLAFLRNEKKFDQIEHLKIQLNADRIQALTILDNCK